MSQTILIVDDDSVIQIILARLLQKDGYAISTAGHAQEALQCLESGPFDLAIFDVQMPETDGLDLLSIVRQRYPEMPVLMLTGSARLQYSIEAVRRGARDYLLKPIDTALVLERVRAVLAEQTQPRRRREIIAQIQRLMDELQQIDGGLSDDARALTASISTSATTRFLRRGPFTLDLQARRALFHERLLDLTPTGFDYLVTLARHTPESVSYQALVLQAQGYQLSRSEAQELVRGRIHELRRAIEEDIKKPRFILTVRGQGYALAV